MLGALQVADLIF